MTYFPTSFATTLHLEENHKYAPEARMMGDDHWYWNAVQAPSPRQTQTYTFTLAGVATEPHTIALRADLHGLFENAIEPDHHTQIYLNGHLVEDALWDGYVDRLTSTEIPSSYLLEGTNAISVTVPADTGVGYDAVIVNWFELDYQREYIAQDNSLAFSTDEAGIWHYRVRGFSTDDVALYDVTDPGNVTRITGGVVEPGAAHALRFQDTVTEATEYLALTPSQRLAPASIARDDPLDLRTPTDGIDYIVISHGDFITDVLPLADYRAAQGLGTMVVDVQDVYDTFSHGVFTPQAIRDFLAYAYDNWSPAPSYVLLVGNGNFDYRCYWRCEPNYIPPYLIYPSPVVGEVAAENRFVTLSGDDLLPDMFIGRLPVSSSAEAATVVAKILAYEQDPPAGDWSQSVLFVADNQPDREENAGDFWDFADRIADGYVPGSYTSERIYYDKFSDEEVPGHPDPPRSAPPYYAEVEDARAAILESVNQGTLLTTYVGHGARIFWAKEKLFEEGDVASLTNGGKLPVFLTFSCNTANFSVPSDDGREEPSLDGALLRAEGGGSVASWGSTKEGTLATHRYLAEGFFTAVFTDGVRELGPASVQGKLALSQSASDNHYLIDTYTILGDPATRLRVPTVGSQGAERAKDRAPRVENGGRALIAAPQDTAQPRYKLSVVEDGMYQLTYDDLQLAGLPVDSLDPRRLQLFSAGSEVRIQVPGEDDGSFDAGDLIILYGQGLDTKYSDTNVYWLTYGEADGLRMLTRDGAPPILHSLYLPLVTHHR